MFACACASAKQSNNQQKNRNTIEQKRGKPYRFTDEEFLQFNQRFHEFAIRDMLTHDGFKESVGIFGIDSLSFLSDRMFVIMDQNDDGRIFLEEYLGYFDVMLHGTKDEKMKQSFDLLDEKRQGQIKLEDFKKIVQSFAQMWSAALGHPMPLNKKYIEKIYQQFAGRKDYFDFIDFKVQMTQYPDLLAWFSKPEEAMNKRLSNRIDETIINKQQMVDQVLNLQNACYKYIEEIGQKLSQCMLIFNEGQSLEDIQRQIRQFKFLVQKDTTRRLSIQSKRLTKFRANENTPVHSSSEQHNRLTQKSARSSSLSVLYSQQSPKILKNSNFSKYVNQQIIEVNLESELFTGKIDLKEASKDFKLEFPIGNQGQRQTINSTTPNRSKTQTIKRKILQKKQGTLNKPLEQYKFGIGYYEQQSQFDVIIEEDKFDKSPKQKLEKIQPQKLLTRQVSLQSNVSGEQNLQSSQQQQYLNQFSFDNQLQSKGLQRQIVDSGSTGSGIVIVSKSQSNQIPIREAERLKRKQLVTRNQNFNGTAKINFQNSLQKNLEDQSEYQSNVYYSRDIDDEQIYEGGDKSQKSNINQLNINDISLNFQQNQIENNRRKSTMLNIGYNAQYISNNQKEISRQKNYVTDQNSDDNEDSQEGNIEKNDDDQSSNNCIQRYEIGNKNIVIMKNNEKYAGAFYFTENADCDQVNENQVEANPRKGSYYEQQMATPIQSFKNNISVIDNNDTKLELNQSKKKTNSIDIDSQVQQYGFSSSNQYLNSIQDNPMIAQILNLIEEINTQIGKKNNNISTSQKTPKKQCNAQIVFLENQQNENEQKTQSKKKELLSLPLQDQQIEIQKYQSLQLSQKKTENENLCSPLQDLIQQSSQKNSNSPRRDTLNKQRTETPQFRAESGDGRLSKLQHTKIESIIKQNYQKEIITQSEQKKLTYLDNNISEVNEEDNNIDEQTETNKNNKSLYTQNKKRTINQVLKTAGNKSLNFNKSQSNQINISNSESKTIKFPKIQVTTDSESEKKQKKQTLQVIDEDTQDYLDQIQENSLMFEAEKPQQSSIRDTIKIEQNGIFQDQKELKKENKKLQITMKFGQMFVSHLIDVLDDFKELIKCQIDEIIETHDQVDQGFYAGNYAPTSQDNQKRQDNSKNRQTIVIPETNKFKSIIKNVPSQRNYKKGLLKEREEVPNSVYGNMATVHLGHENFNMVFNIMIGIKKAVDSTLEIPLLKPTDKDFLLKSQYEIAPYRTDSGDMVKACTFYDYAPQIFQEIRRSSGIKKHQYSKSLGPEHILGYMFNADFQSLKELCSSGKSGSFFYYTSDGNFMLKTIRKDEFKMMKSILRKYYDHLTVRNVDSLISRIYGLHKMIFYRKKYKMQKKIYFCIMNNVFCTPLKIDYRYDLKGSTQGRKTDFVEGQPRDDTVALKDLNFMGENKKVQVGRDYKQMLMKVIDEDTRFFSKCEIIDYSLLVGVHERKKHQQEESPSNNNSLSQFSEADQSPFSARGSQKSYQYHGATYGNQDIPYQHKKFYEQTEGGISSIDKTKIYYIGIIDIFTGYGLKKKAEHFLKSIQYDNQTISCVPPDYYGKRFYDFIEKSLQ